jgi:hypothetical protein
LLKYIVDTSPKTRNLTNLSLNNIPVGFSMPY